MTTRRTPAASTSSPSARLARATPRSPRTWSPPWTWEQASGSGESVPGRPAIVIPGGQWTRAAGTGLKPFTGCLGTVRPPRRVPHEGCARRRHLRGQSPESLTDSISEALLLEGRRGDAKMWRIQDVAHRGTGRVWEACPTTASAQARSAIVRHQGCACVHRTQRLSESLRLVAAHFRALVANPDQKR